MSGRWIQQLSCHVLGLALSGLSPLAAASGYQVSTIDALLAGAYEGFVSVAELEQNGEVGIGTFDGLAGELVMVDGEVYQVTVEGAVVEMPDAATVPFAMVSESPIQEGKPVREPLDMEAFQALVDETAPVGNLPLVVLAQGTFTSVHTRSVPEQERPYPPLAEVVEKQVEFTEREIAGMVVGYRSPDYLKGVNVPGYHLHFLSDDRDFGGHLLGFEMEEGQFRYEYLTRLTMELPVDSAEFREADLRRDRSAELHKVETRKAGKE